MQLRAFKLLIMPIGIDKHRTIYKSLLGLYIYLHLNNKSYC